MIDLRYHIATLVAVFLALGLGILIGNSLVDHNMASEQQKKMVEQINKEFEQLRAQKAELSAENKNLNEVVGYYDEFNREIMPALIKNRLQGEQIALVVTGGAQLPPDLLNTLSLAGARVVSTTVFLPNISLDDPAVMKKVIGYYRLSPETTRDDIQKLVATSVARIICVDGAEADMNFLRQTKLVKMNGQFGVPVNRVVIIGGADDAQHYFPQTIDVPLIEYLKGVNKDIYGVEGARVVKSYMEFYQETGVNTVDDIDMTVGQIALVLSMDGEPGHFGIKETAKKFMPALPVEYLGGAAR